MSIYADFSFLVSLYVTDQHSSLSRQRVLTVPGLWLTPLHRAEWAHAIGQHVFRGILSPNQANQLHHQLEEDESTGVWVQIDIPENALEVCADLARRYGPKLGIRTLDGLHVAVALELQAEGFWTFDDRQLKLAKAAGLRQDRF